MRRVRIKDAIKRLVYYAGYEVRRAGGLGWDPFRDMRRLATHPHRPVIFDVGANVGQSIDLFRRHFDHPIIHAFEPSPSTFRELQRQTVDIPDLHLNNCALGSRSEIKLFAENTYSELSSLLEPTADRGWEVEKRYQVEVQTLDEYCAKRSVTHIDMLKLDTQGFDLEVIKGGSELLALQRIQLLFIEIIFSDMYEGLPRPDEIYSFLTEQGFSLVSFYTFYHEHGRADWADALFVNPEYRNVPQ